MALLSWKDLIEKAEKEGGSSDLSGNIPAGQYNFKILSAEWVDGGTWRGIKINNEVEDGPYKGKRLYKTFFISDNGVSLGIMFRQLRAIGLETEWMGNLPNDIVQACTIIASNLPNRRFIGVVGPQKNKPEYMEIRNILTQKSGPPVADGSPASPTAGGYPTPPATPGGGYPAAPTAPAAPWPTAPAPAAPAPAPAAPAPAPADPWTAQPSAAPAAPSDPWDVQPPTPPAL